MRQRVQDKYLKPVLFSGKAKLIVVDKRTGKEYELMLWGVRGTVQYSVFVKYRKDNLRCNVGYFDFTKGDTLFARDRYADHSWLQLLVDGARFGSPDPNIEAYHLGKCSYCGRELTDPQSVEIGIGPVCRSRLAGLVPMLKSYKWDVT